MTIDSQKLSRAQVGDGGAAFSAAVVRYSLVLLYSFAMAFAYETLSTWWAYFGFTYKLSSRASIFVACMVAALPAILLSHRPKTFAQGSAWFLYLLVFLPSMIVPVMQFSSDSRSVLELFLITLISCILFLIICRRNVSRIELPRIPPRYFWVGVGSIWLIMLLIIMFGFGDTFRFVGLQDIYTQRFEGADVASESALIRYSIAILGSAIDPFLIAYGLYSRRYWISAVGFFGQIVLFGTLAARATLLSPLFVAGVWFLGDKEYRMKGLFLLAALLSIVAVTFPFLLTYNPVGGGMNDLITLIYLRTLLISGSMFGVYEQFFSMNPLTYFSNNNIVSLFVEYPYGSISVGQAVMNYLVLQTGLDMGEANANFLATDGIAALGVIGIPIASVAVALILTGLSKFISPQRTMLMVAAGTGFLLSLANTSFLTSLITGGGLLIVLLVGAAPSRREA